MVVIGNLVFKHIYLVRIGVGELGEVLALFRYEIVVVKRNTLFVFGACVLTDLSLTIVGYLR